MARAELNRLRDMLEAAKITLEYLAEYDFERFAADTKTVDAVVRRLEIVEEAAKSVGQELKRRHPQVAWSIIGRTRDRLIHHYFAVDEATVWQMAKVDLPVLIAQLETILEEENQ